MKTYILAVGFALAACSSYGRAAAQNSTVPATAQNTLTGTPEDRQSFERTKAAVLAAFSRGDIEAILALHHPNVIKYFGGNNVIAGREGLRKQLAGWIGANKVEFVKNTVESTVFNGETVIESSIYEIRNTPKNGGVPSITRGRSVVVYIKFPKTAYMMPQFGIEVKINQVLSPPI